MLKQHVFSLKMSFLAIQKGKIHLKYPQNSILIMLLVDLEWKSSDFRVIF